MAVNDSILQRNIRSKIASILFAAVISVSCSEKEKNAPRPENTLTGYVRLADEFLQALDTQPSGVEVWIDQTVSRTDAKGMFTARFGTINRVSVLRAYFLGYDTVIIPMNRFRLRYEGADREHAFCIDTFYFTPRSTTLCDSVSFGYTLDSSGKRQYRFLAYLAEASGNHNRGADLLLARTPGEFSAEAFSGLLGQQEADGAIGYYFSDSIVLSNGRSILPGQAVVFKANGTSSNPGNQAFWSFTGLNRTGVHRKNKASTPQKTIVLP